MKVKLIIQSRAPLRLGLAGGGTDVSPYCDRYGGAVLNATLNRYAYCVLRIYDKPLVQFESTDLNIVEKYSISDQIDSTGPLDLLKAVYLEIVDRFCDGNKFPVSIHTFCDSPMGSGLGSSSTLVVAIIKAFVEYLNLPLDDFEIANLSFYIERIRCGHQGGRQDQYSATFGGFNFMEFYEGDRAVITPLRIKKWILTHLESSLLLFYSGVSRKSALIISDQASKVQSNNLEAIEAMHGLKGESLIMKNSLLKGDFNEFVDCLKSGWKHKKMTSNVVSNSLIDEIYTEAIKTGALAGKVSGAGGGGFMMFFVPVEKRVLVIKALGRFEGVVSNCHFSSEGTQSWILR